GQVEGDRRGRPGRVARPGPGVSERPAGHLRRGSKDIPDAIRNFQAALATGPEAACLHFRLAGALVRAGRRDESLPCYEMAVRLEPEAGQAGQVVPGVAR